MMRNIRGKILIIFVINLIVNLESFGQYKAIELSASASQYIDDNMDREYEYQSYNQRAISHFILGYSFPLTSNMLLTPRVGVSSASAVYRTNNPFGTTLNPSLSVAKDKNFFFGHASITASYWLRSNFTGLFFTGELWTIVPISAKSEIYKSTLDPLSMQYEEEFINRDIKDQMQSIVPILSIGVGYNQKVAYGVHVFANMNLDYRPTGYFRDTENVTHVNRRLTLGLKYVIEKQTVDVLEDD